MKFSRTVASQPTSVGRVVWILLVFELFLVISETPPSLLSPVKPLRLLGVVTVRLSLNFILCVKIYTLCREDRFS
jgi:hypothetical protein